MAGYKQTEVGAMPKEWDVLPLQAVCRKPITYGIVQCGPDVREGIPYVRVSDMVAPQLNVERMLRTAPSIAARYSRSTLEDGDLVYALRGRLGEVRQVTGAVIGANLTQGTARLAPGLPVLSSYLLWAMRTQEVLRQAETEAKGTTFREITLADLRRIKIAIPPRSEQIVVAAALGDVDALLDGLDRLIAKKRDLKQAAMQQILTGQVRLPGFSSEWTGVRLADVAEIVSGATPRTREAAFWNGGIKWCTPTDITSCHGKYLFSTERTISPLGLASCGARLLPAGALLLCSRATVGEVRIAGCEICTNQGFKALVCGPSVANEWVYYTLLTMRQQMLERAFGSTFLEISKANVAALELRLPLRAEQEAIAGILSDMDAELEALETRREKTRLLKQGMMQELLTGRIRLV